MSEQLVVRTAPRDRKGSRLVVVALGSEVFRDVLDTDSAFRRQKWRDSVVERFSLGEDAHAFLEDELLARSDAADDAGNGTACEPVLVSLADVESKRIDWLWPARIPAGRITTIGGMPGVGKTFAGLDLAARVTTGSPWPDGTACRRGAVVIVNGEDDAGDTIKPRLEASRADLSRVALLNEVREDGERRPFTLRDIATLRQAVESLTDCRLVSIDPIGSFLGAGCDAHRDNEVRAVLAPLSRLAEETGVAVLMMAHPPKAAVRHADDAILGSRAFTGLARAVWHVAAAPDDASRRLMLPGKANLAAKQRGLAFRIEGDPPAVRWEREPIDAEADEVLSRGPASQSQGKLQRAREIIQSALRNGPRGEREVLGACEEAGVSKSTYWRARRGLGVLSEKTEFAGEWLLSLPNGGADGPAKDVTKDVIDESLRAPEHS